MKQPPERNIFARTISRRCVLLLVLSAAFAGRAQSSSDALSQTPTITATSSLVLMPALVSAPAEVHPPVLHSSDFLLTDNGVAQKVTLADTEHQPISLLVLMQTGGAGNEELPLYAKLSTMLSYMTANAPHEVAMVEFDSQPEYTWSFARNVDGFETAFKHPDAGDGGAAILDAVSYGIDLLKKRPANYRRVILLISQTHDAKSHVRADEIVRRLGENNITIESLTFSPEKTWLKDQFTKPRQENPPYQMSPDHPPLLHTFNLSEPLSEAFKALQENTSATVAAVSGGESFSFSSEKELDQQLLTLTNHFAATYMLSFQPTPRQLGFHSLHLQIAGHPEFRVSARTSYWASGESASSR